MQHWLLEHSPIFFDFDGLLVDSESLHYRAYKKMIESHGGAFSWDFETFCSIAHKSATGLRLALTKEFPKILEENAWEDLYKEKQANYFTSIQDGNLTLMDGVNNVLQLVQEAEIPHAVVTNSTLEQVNLFKEKLPLLKSIPTWITRSDYTNPKPAPDAYQEALSRFSGSGNNPIGFEDSMRGVYSLRSAGIKPVLICASTHPQISELKGDIPLHFESFSKML